MEALTVKQLTSRLDENRKAQGEVTQARSEHQNKMRDLEGKISEAAAAVTLAHSHYAEIPSSANKAKLDSSRESHKKLLRSQADHLQSAPDENEIDSDLMILERSERQILTKLRTHRMAKLRDEYNLLMEDVSVNLPRSIAMGYHLSSLMPGSTDPYQHLKVVIPGLLSRIDSQYAQLKGELENEC